MSNPKEVETAKLDSGHPLGIFKLLSENVTLTPCFLCCAPWSMEVQAVDCLLHPPLSLGRVSLCHGKLFKRSARASVLKYKPGRTGEMVP